MGLKSGKQLGKINIREGLHQEEHVSLTHVSEHLRRIVPLMAELLNNTQPEHPFQRIIPQVTGLLRQFREEIDERLSATNQTFEPIPAPHIPDDACGRMRGPQDCYPAPLLRKEIFPRSPSAPPTIFRKRIRQPWTHVPNSTWTHGPYF